jgi:hypothetical protein
VKPADKEWLRSRPFEGPAAEMPPALPEDDQSHLGILSPPPSYLFFKYLLGYAKYTRNIEAIRPLFSSSYWDSRDKAEKP